MQVEDAADPAVGADRLRRRLGALVPGARGAHVVLALEHQGARRADTDAVTAVDARAVRQRHGRLGRDPGIEPAAGDGDRERVLGVLAARLDALVAEDALRVVPDVEVVVDLDRLVDGLRSVDRRRVVVTGLVRLSLARGGEPGWRAVARGIGLVALDVLEGGRRRREVDRRPEELEDHLAAVPDPLGIGLHLHPGLDLAGARRHEHPRARDLDDADAADVDRRQVLEVAEGRRVDALGARGIEDRRAGGDADRDAIDRQLDGRPDGRRRRDGRTTWTGRRPEQDVGQGLGAGRLAGMRRISMRRRVAIHRQAVAAHSATNAGWRNALSIAELAVWPSPQIEASRMTWPSSRRSASSSSRRSAEPAAATSRASSSSWRTVPTRQGTHWPHDSSRKKRAILVSAPTRSAVSSKTITTPEPSVAPIARVASNVSGTSSASGPTKTPAAPPSSTAFSSRPAATPPARSMSSRSVA